MGKIVYLGHYGGKLNERNASPACNAMMEYIAYSITNLEHDLVVFSPAQVVTNQPLDEQQWLNEKCKIYFMPTLPKVMRWNMVGRLIRKYKANILLNRKLLDLIEDGDTVIVYHSLHLIKPVKRIIKKKNITLVLQVCEIYSDVTLDEKTRRKEIEYFRLANKYIFSSNLLEKEINTEKKKFVICLGQYRAENGQSQKFDDDKIHVIYAGTLDRRKGGALAAVHTAYYLNEKYHIHILGFGGLSEMNELENEIEISNKTNSCKVSYEGCLSGNEYVLFLQKCDIGLSTQNPDAAFNCTSFPSKILSYMSNGLRVVSAQIPAVETSAIGKYIHYYQKQTPSEIAMAIKQVDINDAYDSKEILKKMSDAFMADVDDLLYKDDL